MNCLVCLCLNLGGPLRGVAGPPVTLVADLSSSLGGSRLMAVGGWQPLLTLLPVDLLLAQDSSSHPLEGNGGHQLLLSP